MDVEVLQETAARQLDQIREMLTANPTAWYCKIIKRPRIPELYLVEVGYDADANWVFRVNDGTQFVTPISYVHHDSSVNESFSVLFLYEKPEDDMYRVLLTADRLDESQMRLLREYSQTCSALNEAKKSS